MHPGWGGGVFDHAGIGFTIYYFNDKTGFTSPIWPAYTTGYTAVGINSYFKDFSGLVSLWDISGSYSGDIGQGIQLGFAIIAQPSGKFNGNGTLNWNVGNGIVFKGITTINGTVKSSGTATLVSMTVVVTSGSGMAVVSGSTHNFIFAGKIQVNGEIDGDNGELHVTGGSASLKETGSTKSKKISQSIKLRSDGTLTLPDDVTGAWDMTLYSELNGTKYTGMATVETLLGKITTLKATGSYTLLTDTSQITLKGADGSLNMVISTSGTSVTTVFSMKGKLYGQSLNYKAP